MRLALFQPDIPQNVGAAIRLAACLEVPLDLIAPFGFAAGARDVARVAMDYAAAAEVSHHASWANFLDDPARTEGRLVLMTTAGARRYVDFGFAAGDTLVFGRESAGAPAEVHAAAHARLFVPLAPGARSLNLVAAAAITLGEALRQTRWSA